MSEIPAACIYSIRNIILMHLYISETSPKHKLIYQ